MPRPPWLGPMSGVTARRMAGLRAEARRDGISAAELKSNVPGAANREMRLH